MADDDKACSCFERSAKWKLPTPERLTQLWSGTFLGETLSDDSWQRLIAETEGLKARTTYEQHTWVADADELKTAAWFLPFLLGLKRSGNMKVFSENPKLFLNANKAPDALKADCLKLLVGLGIIDENHRLTDYGSRVIQRGTGPFGIIYAYHPYMIHLHTILQKGRGTVWVRRKFNIGASQDANAKTFSAANKMLSRFCDDTSFRFRVFIEHALGKGEATRQRYVHDSNNNIQWVGADLEDAAIDAAEEEQEKGHLPKNMIFVRNADIGLPEKFLDVLAARNIEARNAVMMVGNGFHEVRQQSTEKMVGVFKTYHEAGMVLCFTEETGLGTSLIQRSARNTYHAGFRYVHEKSGQGLRPATDPPPSYDSADWPASWFHCITEAGYLYLSKYAVSTRNIFPFEPADGYNPPISLTYFCVPQSLGKTLGLG